jgi:uncharacterized protein
LKALLIFLISLYQRFISPYKGYRCAHAAYHHGPSCSHAVKAIIAEHGAWHGYALIRRRLAECGYAARQLQGQPDPKNPQRRRKRNCGGGDGDWDGDDCVFPTAGCGGCDNDGNSDSEGCSGGGDADGCGGDSNWD